MRVFVSILFSFFLFATYAHAALPDWVGRPLPIEQELLQPPEIEGMVFIKGGCFDMGDTFGEGDGDERPVHTVCLDNFYIGKYEVTQREWVAVMGSNPSSFRGCDTCPVESVSWNDAQEYISKLNSKTGQMYRLPTEAEWEYAARSGGKLEKFSGTNDNARLGDFTWYDWNSGKKIHPVGEKRPNGLDLYDLSGNVCEWVSDWYGESYYQDSSKVNPTGPSKGQYKVLRGGSWLHKPVAVSASKRILTGPSFRDNSIGFRLALSPTPSE